VVNATPSSCEIVGKYQRLQTLSDFIHLPVPQGNQIPGLTGRFLKTGFSMLMLLCERTFLQDWHA
jgi:hypothetical protein